MSTDITIRINCQCVCGEVFQIEAFFSDKAIGVYREWRKLHEQCIKLQVTVDKRPVPWLVEVGE